MAGDMKKIIEFNEWLGSLSFKHKVVIPGNHDKSFDPTLPQGKNGQAEAMKALMTNCILLDDSYVTIYGIKIYGSPFSRAKFGKGYGFQLRDGTKVRRHFML